MVLKMFGKNLAHEEPPRPCRRMIPGVADARPGVASVLSRVGVGLARASPKGLGRQSQTSARGGPLL